MPYIMGIDGGGSGLRVAITTPQFDIIAQAEGDSANPSSIGREESARRIIEAAQAALATANLQPEDIVAIGLGIAGAASTHSADWLHTLAAEIVPKAVVAPSSDYEIALVGAHGQRRGVLLLAGTGSLAYGVNNTGQSVLAGAWGYLIGDEGSGYWFGTQAIRAAVRAADGRGRETVLLAQILHALNLEKPLDIIPWLYQTNRTRDVAALAPLVIKFADVDPVAREIVEEAVGELVTTVRAVYLRLNTFNLPVAFTGSLLSEPNALSRLVCESLGLSSIPMPKYPPVIGAAILARSIMQINKSAAWIL